MSKEEFEGTCRSYGFEEDREYSGLWRVAGYGEMCISWVDEKTMTVGWDIEYTWECSLTDKRLVALKEAFEKRINQRKK